MKYYRILFLSAALAGLASCAVDPLKEYQVEKPQSIAEYEYLNDYDVLKNYVGSSASPDFKLGAAVAGSDFEAHGQVYALAVSNFNELTPVSEMNHASIVGNDGTMSVDAVRNYVNNASDAGLTAYGSTLAWHAQQNNKYLNTLIADKELEVEEGATNTVVDAEFDYSTYTGWYYWGQGPEGSTRGIVDGVFQSVNPTAVGFWEFQYHVADGIPWVNGRSYKITMMIRASEATSFTLAAGTWDGQHGGTFEVGTEWQEVTVSRTSPVDGNGFVMFQSGNFVGTIEMQWMKITHEEAMAVSWWTPIISNGDAEGTDCTNFVSTHVGATNGPADIVDGAGVDGTRAFVVTSAGGGTNSWDTQFFLYTERKLVDGDKVKLEFDYKADVANNAESQAHGTPGAYIHWDGGAAMSFTTDWQHFSKTIVINSTVSPEGNMQTFAWNLDVGAPSAPVNKYYFDNIQLSIEESGNTIPQTPEEKKDTLTTAMNNWVKAMMEVTAEKVTAWDVVKEPLSNVDADGDGYYDLRSAENGDASANFYWADYLGTDYVATVAGMARAYNTEFGGAGLKLFVNESGLEDAKKVSSLINWIGKWEAAGQTIDGIAVQMNVKFNEDATAQQANEAAVADMFKALAASDKLVKVASLDVTYVDANGSTVGVTALTEAQLQAMASYYSYIVAQYLANVPAAQQYGITLASVIDGTNAISLWNANYSRNHAYAGFAEGLGGTPSAE
nr:endo-1,4-beta-xylanase [uncultured bacterium]